MLFQAKTNLDGLAADQMHDLQKLFSQLLQQLQSAKDESASRAQSHLTRQLEAISSQVAALGRINMEADNIMDSHKQAVGDQINISTPFKEFNEYFHFSLPNA